MSGCLLWKFVHMYINISSGKVCHFSWIFSDHFDCVSFDCDSQWSWRTHPCELCVSHACEFRIKGAQMHPRTTETLQGHLPNATSTFTGSAEWVS